MFFNFLMSRVVCQCKLVLNMTINMEITTSNYYSSTSDEHKKVENQLKFTLV